MLMAWKLISSKDENYCNQSYIDSKSERKREIERKRKKKKNDNKNENVIHMWKSHVKKILSPTNVAINRGVWPMERSIK